MHPRHNHVFLASFIVSLGPAVAVRAECPVIDFENLVLNTAVTTQYDGVTFSVVPQSCGNNPTLYMRIKTVTNGTSSGTKCLRIDGGCPDFSDDYLRMVFDVNRSKVSFTVGDWATTYAVRAYSTTGGAAGLISTTNVVIPPAGGGDVGVHRGVTVTAASNNIRRIEVQAATSNFEAIDDLSFISDDTIPTAEITSPAQLACVCNLTSVVGSAYDPDGDITNWQLHRRGLGAATWVLIKSSTVEVQNAELAVWSTSASDGWYTLRLRVTNQCGLIDEVFTDVYLDRVLNNLSVRSPTAGSILGGTVCADGTISDHCNGSFTVEYRPVGGGFQPFNPISPPWVTNDPLGSWNTRAGVVDGDYEIRASAADGCGNTAASPLIPVTVDNTPPVALISSPISCTYVGGTVEISGTANDTHLAAWALYYAGDDAHSWVPIATGNTPVINGVLGSWSTGPLRTCAYLLRLVVSDQAVLDCGGYPNQSEYLVSVNVGTPFDGDGDRDVDQTDFGLFQRCMEGPDIPVDPGCAG